MKKAICNLVHVCFLGALIFCPTISLATGGGGGGGNDRDNIFNNPSAPEYFGSMGGGVSWTPNPNGPGVFGSSIYDGRPENIEKGPYQSGTAIEDAEALLLAGYVAGNYTPQDVKEQLAWAEKVGLTISDKAQNTLDLINKPKKEPAKVSKSASQKEDKFDLFLKIAAAIGKKSTDNKKKNKSTTANDLLDVAAGEIVKQNIANIAKELGF